MPPSATVAINEHSNALLSRGEKVFKFGLGQSPFPVPDSVVQALRDHAHEKDYLPVRGLQQLRQAVADYHQRRDGLVADADDVLIGPGSKELMFLLQLVFYGDLVIPTPSWVSYAPQANIIGRKVRWLATSKKNNWMVQPDELERLCKEDPGRPRVLVLNYPSNPTGDSYTTAQLKALAQAARQNRCLVLSDEIYGELHFKGQHTSISRYYPEGTIVSSGLSKWCGAGGWRLGTFVFPKQLHWLLDGMGAVASETFTSTSAPIQYAAVRAFEGGDDIEQYLNHSRKLLAALGKSVATQLGKAGVDVERPKGGFYLFPDFSPLRESLARRGITDSTTLCHRMLDDTGVAFLPGSHFGRPSEELTARMAYVDFDGAKALDAVAALGDDKITDAFLNEHCDRVMEATRRMCQWLA